MCNFMKRLISTVSLFISLSCLGQKAEFFKKFNFDKSYSVIGIGPHWATKGDTYKRFSFFVDKLEDLNNLKKEWVFKQKSEVIAQQNHFSVYILKDKKIVGDGVINPSFSNIRADEGWYYFDTALLEEVAKKHFLNYTVHEDTFSTTQTYFSFYAKIKEDSSFLFLFPPDLEFEGSFRVSVRKTDELSSPKAAIEELERKFNLLTTKDKYHTTYVLDEYNLKNQNQWTLTVQADKLLFDKFNDDIFIKDKWARLVLLQTEIIE